MEDQNSTPVTSADAELDAGANGLFEEFTTSMKAMQLQDLNTAEQSLLKARNYYRVLSGKLTGGDLAPFSVLVNSIEVITRVLRSSYLAIGERYRKAMEELAAAKKVCDVSGTYFGGNNVGADWDMFKFYFQFFECIIAASANQFESMLQMAAGKFVDEIEVIKEANVELRRINEYPFPHDEGNSAIAMVNLLNKMADLNEEKLEKLEERREKIEFMRPIDRKVFIVHGHDEVILGQLKDILKTTLQLEPIVLKELGDNGRTVIEKFEDYGKLCAFAFVIVTPDDTVETKDGKYFQGRPNVLFELGWFCGRFGRDKVRILRQSSVQLPSDLNGLLTIDFQVGLAEVTQRISNDLESFGIVGKGV
jgi:predicted nucleotide-binding protein